MQVVVNNLLTTYEEVGKGKQVVLFLHGWADSGKSFQNLADELVKANKKIKVILLDLPGFGGSQGPSEAWGLEDYAEFVAQFLEKVDYSADVIIGHSNGGAIAIKGLATNVLQARKLVLLASAGIRNPSLKKTLLRIAAKPTRFAIMILPGPTQKKIKQKMYGAIGSDYLVVAHMQDTFKRVVSSDIADNAKDLTIPTCLIYGEKDTSTPVEFGERLAGLIPNSRLYTIPLTGHFLHHEQLYKVRDYIGEFIK